MQYFVVVVLVPEVLADGAFALVVLPCVLPVVFALVFAFVFALVVLALVVFACVLFCAFCALFIGNIILLFLLYCYDGFFRR